MKKLTIMLVALAAMLALAAPAMAQDQYDCSDFVDQGQAQENFNNLGSGDPSNLDSDGDGQACEELPTAVDAGGGETKLVPNDAQSASASSETPASGAGQYAATDQYSAPAQPEATVLPETGGSTPLLLLAGLAIITGGALFGYIARRYS